jgi:SPP1 gp7 family putative phage head morphogenesis protein
LKTRFLAPIFDRQSDIDAFKTEIVRLLRREVFSPLLQASKTADLLSALGRITPEEVAQKLDPSAAYRRVFRHIDTSFRQSMRKVQNAKSARSLALLPRLSLEETKQLHEEYTANSRLSIVDFLHEMLEGLHKDVQKHVMSGGRQEELAKRLRAEWGMAERKAEFIARNETSILSAKLKEARYAAAGVDDYEWRCVSGTAAHPVRHMHLILDGTRQKFSSPPVVNPQGQRKNPGEDYNCRCYARPIIKF